MPCCGDREKLGEVRTEQKWEYLNWDDFKSQSCWTPMSYGILYISLIISVSVYAVDTFTAINLLAFDRWSGKIKPAIPLHISRWIFAGCIILSFVLLFYRWLRAIRVMQNGSVAQNYLDPLAVRIQSIRMGENGRGWKRFLIFAALTKSRKGADYVALFTYFSFEAWLRILFAEGPRQVINALTLYSVMRLSLIPEGKHAASDGHTPIVQFFVNVGVLASSDREQAVILFGMLFTLIVWVITAINLAVAVLMYLLFLWHHIPSSDGGLSGYCRRKIDGRMEKIVRAKVAKALAKESHAQQRRELADGKDVKRQPTLPNLGASSDDQLPNMPLSRQTTQTTLPLYESRPSTAGGDSLQRQPTLPDISLGAHRPPAPSRTATESSAFSNASYGSNAPLLASANDMGWGPPGRSESPVSPPTPGSAFGQRPPVGRSITAGSQMSQRSYTAGSRPPTSQDRRTPGPYGPPPRSGTAMSNGPQGSMGRRTPGPPLPPLNVNTPPIELQPRGTPSGAPNGFDFPFGTTTPSAGIHTPGPPLSTRSQTPASAGGYVAFNPSLHSSPATNGPDVSQRKYMQPRNFTQPGQPRTDNFGQQATSRPAYPQRSGTAPLPQQDSGGFGDIYDSYADAEPPPRIPMPPRAATTTPGGGAWIRQPRQDPGAGYAPRY